MTYPSVLEGWGNQLLETMFAKKPVIVYEYPVFERDLSSSGIEYISLGNACEGREGNLRLPSDVIDGAAKRAVEILFDEKVYRLMVSRNFAIGEQLYSYEALETILTEVIGQ